ncbi:hypothetical protein EV193_11048 [Herbihabitans rhizosphaerae]|uniref:Uncharacterized protein n=1 Tax=Herbihabitans rhizosphaerae TaxID=1872711 RepID=A0A4Q7KG55_9PSEU|nr:hypothetical protein EV193_11048 [Herbihabitans rhizosphaerae]
MANKPGPPGRDEITGDVTGELDSMDSLAAQLRAQPPTEQARSFNDDLAESGYVPEPPPGPALGAPEPESTSDRPARKRKRTRTPGTATRSSTSRLWADEPVPQRRELWFGQARVGEIVRHVQRVHDGHHLRVRVGPALGERGRDHL